MQLLKRFGQAVVVGQQVGSHLVLQQGPHPIGGDSGLSPDQQIATAAQHPGEHVIADDGPRGKGGILPLVSGDFLGGPSGEGGRLDLALPIIVADVGGDDL